MADQVVRVVERRVVEGDAGAVMADAGDASLSFVDDETLNGVDLSP